MRGWELKIIGQKYQTKRNRRARKVVGCFQGWESEKLKLLTSLLPSLFPFKVSWLPVCLCKGWADRGPGEDPLLRVIWTRVVLGPQPDYKWILKLGLPHLLWGDVPTDFSLQLPYSSYFSFSLLALASRLHISLSPHLFEIKSCFQLALLSLWVSEVCDIFLMFVFFQVLLFPV